MVGKKQRVLKMKVVFEPSYLGMDALVRAYEQALPTVRRPIVGRASADRADESLVVPMPRRRRIGETS